MNSDRIKSLANIVASNLSEAANRTKRNPTRDFLRRYPVSDTEIVRPVKKQEKKKEEKQGVAEVAFKDPSPMMKDSIKQDKIRSLKNLIAVAKVKGIHHKVKEYESELKKLKETTEVTEAGAFSYGAKPPRKGSVAYNALMQRKEQDKKRVKEIEAIGTKNHHVGVAKVTKEQIEDVTEIYKYIDQSGGHQIKGKSGTFVGYTHSATKGKGANILKHNQTKKYYAAGGSSTAFTAKTTLHDTPEDAARAYHKGNLAEENIEEGSNSETEGMVSYIHHIIKNHVYPRAGDKEGYMKHVAKHMPTIVKSNPKLFRRAHSIAYDRFFHVDKNDDYDHTDYSMRQGERGMREGLAEENNQLDEISLGNYKEKAQKEVGELKPYAKGEYGDFAKKIIAKRKAGLQRAMKREDVNNEAYMGKVKLVSNPREKWMKSVKDRGYDMRAGAQRLQDLLDKQKKERAEIEQRAKEKGLEY